MRNVRVINKQIELSRKEEIIKLQEENKKVKIENLYLKSVLAEIKNEAGQIFNFSISEDYGEEKEYNSSINI